VYLVVQVLTWVLSYDGEQSPEPLAITAAGAALAVSGQPHPPPFPHKSTYLTVPLNRHAAYKRPVALCAKTHTKQVLSLAAVLGSPTNH